jgi:DNA-3-methyladenine glycosylase II
MRKPIVIDPKILEELSRKDPVIGAVMQKVPPLDVRRDRDYFVSLIQSIVGQQLSTKVADIIYGRFELLFANKQITPDALLTLEPQKIRDIGISWSKISYMQNIARFVLENETLFTKLDDMTDEEIIEALTTIKGVGRWTVEMFLIFTMGREDVFSHGDLGLRKAIKNLYGLEEMPTVVEAEKIVEVWKPYRSIASRYLWKSLDL